MLPQVYITGSGRISSISRLDTFLSSPFSNTIALFIAMKFAVILSAIISAAYAINTELRTRACRAIPQLAKYENLQEPLGNFIGTYMGINYTAFQIADVGIGGGAELTGVIPKSGSHFAGVGPGNDILVDTPSLAVATSYSSFSLKYLYMGCVVTTVETDEDVPEACTLAFTAYKPGQSKVAFDTINQHFNPTNLTLSKMTKAVFPRSWAKMGKIEVAVVDSTSPPDTVTYVIDNTKCDLFKCI